LVDRARALSYARAAFELAPDQPEALAQLEEASALARDWAPFVEAVSAQLAQFAPVAGAGAPGVAGARADDAAEGDAKDKKRRNRRGGRRRRRDTVDEQRELSLTPEPPAPSDPALRRLEMKLAQVCDKHLSRTDDAIALLHGMIARDPADDEAISYLEKLLRREGRRD